MHKSQKIVLSFLMAASLASATTLTQGETKPAALADANNIQGANIKSVTVSPRAGVSVVYRVHSVTDQGGSSYYDIYSQVQVASGGPVFSQSMQTDGAVLDVTQYDLPFGDFVVPTQSVSTAASYTSGLVTFTFSAGLIGNGPIVATRVSADHHMVGQAGQVIVTGDLGAVFTAGNAVCIKSDSLTELPAVTPGSILGAKKGIVLSPTATLEYAVYLVGLTAGVPTRDFYFQVHSTAGVPNNSAKSLAVHVQGAHFAHFRLDTGFANFTAASGGFSDVTALLTPGATTFKFSSPVLGGAPWDSPIVRMRVVGAYTNGAFNVSVQGIVYSLNANFVNREVSGCWCDN